LHELGHALGLKHGHAPEYGNDVVLSADRNSLEFSLMTYADYIGANVKDGFSASDAPQTYMMYDIAALQHLYGANFNTNNTGTVYSWDPNTGATYVNGEQKSALSKNRIFMTIWDGGGTDTYDMSNHGTTNLNINLAPGGWSVFAQSQLAALDLSGIHFARGNVCNALQYNGDLRSLIENAIGAAGNDTIRGGVGDDGLTGDEGDDWLYGEGGNDWISGDNGNDVLDGGGDNDTLCGGAGEDILYGGVGNDEMWGGAGYDMFVFKTALNGTANVDQIRDFEIRKDVIVLHPTVFAGFGSTVSLAQGTSATAWQAQIIYDSATGDLFYDADGLGQAAQIKFAAMSPGLALAQSDFWIVAY
jgi:serralysin